MVRNKFSQSKHDKAVRKSAAGFLGQGFDVEADIPGYPKPSVINGNRPDIVARKGGKTVLVEWETPSSLGTDKAQRSAFRKYARSRRNVSFRTRVAR